MKRSLRLRRESLSELTSADLAAVNGASTPFITDGHHCFGSALCPLSVPLSCVGCRQTH